MTTITDIAALRLMVRGAYDLQALRIQSGLRLCANFRAKLKKQEGEEEGDIDEDGEMSAKAKKLMADLKASYRRLTDGVARNRTLPKEEGFVGDELISTFSELTLIDQYVRIEAAETKHFAQMESILDKIPIYTSYLKGERGIGPAMAGVLVSYLDPHKARHVSSFWKYGGLDVAHDGLARSRRQEHLVERTYIDKNRDEKTRLGVTFNPFLRTKLLGVLTGCFLRSESPWRQVYDGRKHRMMTSPNVEKVTLVEWKRRRKAGEDVRSLWTPGRINNDAKRYMVKMFLAELWAKWRALENLPVTPPYSEAKMGMRPHKAA